MQAHTRQSRCQSVSVVMEYKERAREASAASTTTAAPAMEVVEAPSGRKSNQKNRHAAAVRSAQHVSGLRLAIAPRACFRGMTASITEQFVTFLRAGHGRAGGTAGVHSQRVDRSIYFPRDSRRGSIRRPDDSNSRFKFRVYPKTLRSSSKTPNANAGLITETWESRRASTHTPSAKRSLRRSPRTCLSLSTSNTVVPEATSPPSML